MDTKAVTTDYRLQQWAEILQRQKESGYNIRKYCKEAGIKEHIYYYWQRKLREAACKELSKVQNDMKGLTPSRNRSPVMWAGVDMNTLHTTDIPTGNNIKICRDGWTVTIEPGFDTGTLTEALKAVNRACC